MTDSYGRKWNYEDATLDEYVKTHKLNLIINYIKKSGKTYFRMILKDQSGALLIDLTQLYPPSDSELLVMIKGFIRDKKIDQLINGHRSITT